MFFIPRGDPNMQKEATGNEEQGKWSKKGIAKITLETLVPK